MGLIWSQRVEVSRSKSVNWVEIRVRGEEVKWELERHGVHEREK